MKNFAIIIIHKQKKTAGAVLTKVNEHKMLSAISNRHRSGVILLSISSIWKMHSTFCFFLSHFFIVGRSKYNLLPWRINGITCALTALYTADFDLPSNLYTSSIPISSPSRGCGCVFSQTVFSSDSIHSTSF